MVDSLVIADLAHIRRSAHDIAKGSYAPPAFHLIYDAARQAEADSTLIDDMLERIVSLASAHATQSLLTSGTAHNIYVQARDAQFVIETKKHQMEQDTGWSDQTDIMIGTPPTQANSARFNDDGWVVVSYDGYDYTLSIDVVKAIKDNKMFNAIRDHRANCRTALQIGLKEAKDMIEIAADMMKTPLEIPEYVDGQWLSREVRRLMRQAYKIDAIKQLRHESKMGLLESKNIVEKAGARCGRYYKTEETGWNHY